MVQKPELIAFGQNSLGGVLSFYENLLNSKSSHAFDKKLILLQRSDLNYPKPYYNFIDTEVTVFNFSPNQIIDTAFELSKSISDRPGIVITSFRPELAALHLFRRKNKTVYYICHDELYLSRAKEYSFLIDIFIAHNPYIYNQLCEQIPNRKDSIYFIPYGIDFPDSNRRELNDEKINLVFLARHVPSKGIYDIPRITQILKSKGVPYHWTICGDGENTEDFRKIMEDFDEITFTKYSSKQQLFDILQKQHLFILPSSLDGVPVAMLECMSAGVVPIIYEFNPGIKLLLNSNCGVIVPVGNYEAIANQICTFYKDMKLLSTFSENAQKLIRVQFDYAKQTELYFELFDKFLENKKPIRRKLKNYSGWLSNPFVPKKLAYIIRKIKSNKH